LLRSLLPWGPGHPLLTSGSGILIYGRGCITSLSVLEATGSATATVTFHDGTGTNMQVLLDVAVASGASAVEQWNPHCLPFEEGIYVNTTVGSCKGSITVWTEHWCRWWMVAPQRAAELQAADALAQMGITT
jgi:hypothetical protein